MIFFTLYSHEQHSGKKNQTTLFPIWYWNKSFVLIYEQTYLESRTEVDIFSEMPIAVLRYSHHTVQIRVKLFVLNENAARHLHLHLDPCQSPSRRMGSTPRKITQ